MTTRDGGRERELKDLGVKNPRIDWLALDRVRIEMSPIELDRIIEAANDKGYDLGHEDGHLDGFDQGRHEGRAEVIREIEALAAATKAAP